MFPGIVWHEHPARIFGVHRTPKNSIDCMSFFLWQANDVRAFSLRRETRDDDVSDIHTVKYVHFRCELRLELSSSQDEHRSLVSESQK